MGMGNSGGCWRCSWACEGEVVGESLEWRCGVLKLTARSWGGRGDDDDSISRGGGAPGGRSGAHNGEERVAVLGVGGS
jgi:hypothetical protein